MTPHAICVCLLWVVTGCCWSDDGSVEQRSGIIGSDAHRQVADEIGDVVISVLGTEGLLF